ncbi:CMP-N-acetylneuraminate-poly-alpha-2,8-sialyltransferase-like [Asterias amurensis]|uniref:CMP-N-acetylneuraminate-poly-alpha-2, 8-sialyltransferase-like n=1 Tax=Asterias amurensis TaxID=7602 RepID=UPI003AB3EE9C
MFAFISVLGTIAVFMTNTFLWRNWEASIHETTNKPLKCKSVCSKSTGLCVRIDLAVFVLKETSNSSLEFREQLTYPTVNSSSTEQPSDCYMEDHYPGLELIPRQASCAVVGNSGILNNSSCGDAIDSHDFVFRVNMPTIKGYERDVGRKTNITCINTSLLRTYSGMFKRPNYPVVGNRFLEKVRFLGKSVLWYPKPLGRDNAQNYRLIINAIKSDGNSLLRYAFSWKPIHIEREWKIGNCGTLGFDAFVVARTFCDNISLFGFYPFYADPDGKPLRYHYFDDVLSYNFNNTRVHNFGREYKILQKLDAEKKLKLVAGSCSL